ncbi:MAG: hypothetical protein K2G85_00065 [Muribaculaceae bacterium]|nr:hypothetical protein [Muribaculaceae bacterium]
MEKENDIIYDLEAPGAEPAIKNEESVELCEESRALCKDAGPTDSRDMNENPTEPTQSAESDQSESAEDENMSQAETELQKMLEEMGAETLLEIIKDNRNVAIRQIISEVESQQRNSYLRSGVSAPSECQSIFDLAALA